MIAGTFWLSGNCIFHLRRNGLKELTYCNSNIVQEALLPQTDRATRYVSQNLANYRNKLYNN